MSKNISKESIEQIRQLLNAGTLKTDFQSVERFDSKMSVEKANELPKGQTQVTDLSFGEVMLQNETVKTTTGIVVGGSRQLAKIPVTFTLNGQSLKFKVNYFTALALEKGSQPVFNVAAIGDDEAKGVRTVWVTTTDEKKYIHLNEQVAEAATV